jgi:hypothetical protein
MGRYKIRGKVEGMDMPTVDEMLGGTLTRRRSPPFSSQLRRGCHGEN